MNERLRTYREKRTPGQTPEPFGGSSLGARRFVVQKHAARRMHYDLRLEWGGTLHSWAVPRGPSAQLGDRRAAIMTEPHPLGYADFEGIIPAGNYGAGAMIVWDQGLWIPLVDPEEGLRQGKLPFELRGHKMKGAWELILPQKQKSDKEWLLFKKRDGWAGDLQASMWNEESVFSGLTVEELRDGNDRNQQILEMIREMGAPRRRVEIDQVKLMLAESRKTPFSKPGWCFELKYDGYRVLASKEEGHPRLQYRSGSEATRIYPSIVRLLRGMPYRTLIMDGEVVTLDEQARPDFNRLAKRARLSRSPDILRADIENPAVLYLFDILAFDDYDLRGLPYLKRKQILARIVPAVGPLRYADHLPTKGRELFEKARKAGVEGLLAKKSNAPYRAGRSPAWVKIRVGKEEHFVIVGYVHPRSSGRSGFASLELAVFDGRDYVYVGSVGTGFTQKQIDEIHGKLAPLERDSNPCKGDVPDDGRSWVEPHFTCTVRYGDWTDAERLRHAVFVTMLEDVRPEECRGPESAPESEPPPSAAPSRERQVKITNPKKLFWPEDGYTKRDLIDYYAAVSEQALPLLIDRPVVLTRYPDGIEGKSFFQKNAPDYVPDWVRRERVWSESAEREIDYFICDNPESLVYLANMAAIPLHVWSSRTASLDRPDWTIIDLDPKGAPFDDVVRIAQAFHDLCDDIGLPSYCKTSGSSGLHVLVPLGAGMTYSQSRSLAELLSRVVALQHHDIATLFRSLNKRDGKVYLDTVQNGHGRLLVSAYSLRPLPGAPVSTPLRWGEVRPGLNLHDYNIVSMPQRLKEQTEDPWKGLLQDRPDFAAVLGKLDTHLKAGLKSAG